MRVSYPVSYQSFVALQPPFVPIAPMGRGLFFFFQFAVPVAGIGFELIAVRVAYLFGWTSWRSANLTHGFAILALGALPILGVVLARRASARKARRDHDDFLRGNYESLHCRDNRFVELTPDGLSIGCACKSKLHPWSQLSTVVETPAVFILATRLDTQIIPKDAFASEASRTEFRTLLSEKLNENKSLHARTIEFVCTPADWRDASRLRLKSGGWIKVLALAFSVCGAIAMILFFAPILDDSARVAPPFIAAACGFALLVVILLVVFRRKPFRYLGPLKVSFGEDAIYVQSPTSEGRIPWSHITGCAGDRKCMVFLYRPFSILLIPLRAIPPAQAEYVFGLLKAKLTKPSPQPSAPVGATPPA
jgi:hypothetical protein